MTPDEAANRLIGRLKYTWSQWIRSNRRTKDSTLERRACEHAAMASPVTADAYDDVANAAAGPLVLCRDEVTYSPAQRLRDNMKIEAVYKKWARSVA